MDNRELDKRIAEKVMNITAWMEKRGGYEHIVFQREGEREPYRGTQHWEEASKRYRIIPFSEIDHHNHIVGQLPSYSTNIKDAFEVVDKLQGDVIIQKGTDGRYYVSIYQEGNNVVSDWTDNAPLAICKAALLSLEGRTT